jgi:hypothetical protein
MEPNDNLEVNPTTKVSFRSSTLNEFGRKSTKPSHPAHGLLCEAHSKEVVFICVKENCSKRPICMKCVSEQADHLADH